MSRQATDPSLGLEALQSVLPSSLIEQALAEADRRAQRRRKLPPSLVLWLLVGMGLFRTLNIRAVLGRLRDCMGGVPWGAAELPHPTSIAHARDRLGVEAVRILFTRVSAQLAASHTSADMWRGMMVRILDGTTFLVSDTKANDEAFGRPGTSRGGPSAFPQLRAVQLIGSQTHLVRDVAFGPYASGELTLAKEIVARMEERCVVLLDRAFYAYAFLVALLGKRSDFIVRRKTGRCALKPKKRKQRRPSDPSAVLRAPPYLRRRDPSLPEEIGVRLVRCKKSGFRSITLVTSLTAAEISSEEIASLYLDRWEVELGLREVKVHMGAKHALFRSRTADRVRQEAYGLYIAFNCLRALMAEAAAEAGVRPRELGFTACLEHVRWALALFANGGEHRARDLATALARYRLPPRRSNRVCPRAVKIKMSNYPRKRHDEKPATTRDRNRRQKGRRSGRAA